jgi:hypothetical protein
MQYQDYDETWESPIEGLSEEELELRAARHVRELRAIRDELLATCETIHEWLGADDAAQALPFEPPWYQQLRAAIAKARGEASNG